MKSKIKELLERSEIEPVIFIYNDLHNDRAKLEITDALSDEKQEELANKLFALVESYLPPKGA